MQVRLITTDEDQTLVAIKDALSWSHTALLSVAYASYGAFRLIQDDFNSFLRNDGKLRSLFDIEKYITDSEIIEELATIPGDSECKVFSKVLLKSNQLAPGSFHCKQYVFFDDTKFTAIVGSSNFTYSGLLKNLESNIILCGKKDDLFNNLKSYFWALWRDKCSINILTHGDLLIEYQNIFNANEEQIKRSKTF